MNRTLVLPYEPCTFVSAGLSVSVTETSWSNVWISTVCNAIRLLSIFCCYMCVKLLVLTRLINENADYDYDHNYDDAVKDA